VTFISTIPIQYSSISMQHIDIAAIKMSESSSHTDYRVMSKWNILDEETMVAKTCSKWFQLQDKAG